MAAGDIRVFVTGGKGYVYSAEEAQRLRTEHRIVGNMVGGITAFKMQTSVGGLPLELSPDEVTIAVKKGWVKLLSGKEGLNFRKTVEGCSANMTLDETLARNTSIAIPNLHHEASNSGSLELRGWDYPKTEGEKNRFAVFSDLHEKGFFLTGGAKFGGDWLAYPGDPLVYHAQFVVRLTDCGGLPPLLFASVAREAHAARKHLLIVATKKGEDGQIAAEYVTVAPTIDFGKQGTEVR
ncbi:hypothetical protein BSKO_07271 [Bryopsis sp. KO-2023]|nr:hypothetical protein BSKO_07271 [Bryopsis sp. KO-2023]